MSSQSRCCSPIAGEELKLNNDNINKLVLSLKRCSSSSDFWSELPVDVKVEILCRLPEKDLIRSKFVSKEWNFIISNICVRRFSPPFPSVPFYASLLFEEPAPPPDAGAGAGAGAGADVGGYDDDFDPYAGKLNFQFLGFGKYVLACKRIAGKPTIRDHILNALPTPDPDPADIQDCCNGLLLLASDRLQCPTQYYIYNPATRQRIAVPRNPNHRTHITNHHHHHHCSLVFDPSCYDYNYKIIRYVRSARDATISEPMQLDIFSSEAGEWSSHVVPLEPQNLYGFEWIRRSVYWDGILYYVSLARYLVYIQILGSADLRARAVELPDRETIDEECGCIGISSRCLCYSNRHSKRSAVLVWKLVANPSHEWVLMHTISIDDIAPFPPFEKIIKNYRYSESFRPRGFHPDGDEILMAAPRFLLYYHFKTKKINMCHIPWHKKRKTILLDQNLIFPYSRSLVLLRSFTGMN